MFIDSHDLINVFNRQEPVSIEALADRFRDHGHELVVPWSLICELCQRAPTPKKHLRGSGSLRSGFDWCFSAKAMLSRAKCASL